jgi:hypothetical protein
MTPAALVLDGKKLAAFSALGGGFLRFPIGERRSARAESCRSDDDVPRDGREFLARPCRLAKNARFESVKLQSPLLNSIYPACYSVRRPELAREGSPICGVLEFSPRGARRRHHRLRRDRLHCVPSAKPGLERARSAAQRCCSGNAA